MGVISPTGVAGTIITVSDNMAIAMSLLNSQSRLSAKLKKSGETGQAFLGWQEPQLPDNG